MNKLSKEEVKKIVEKQVKGLNHLPTMIEKCFDRGYDRGYLDALYKARQIIQNCDFGYDDLYEDIIEEYENRNIK